MISNLYCFRFAGEQAQFIREVDRDPLVLDEGLPQSRTYVVDVVVAIPRKGEGCHLPFAIYRLRERWRYGRWQAHKNRYLPAGPAHGTTWTVDRSSGRPI